MQAAEDIRNLSLSTSEADKTTLNNLRSEFAQKIAPGSARPDGVAAISGPSAAPAPMNGAVAYTQRSSVLGTELNGMANTRPIDDTAIATKLAAKGPSFGGMGVNTRQFGSYYSLMSDNLKTAGTEMDRVVSYPIPAARFAPGISLLSPTARGTAEGRIPDNSPSDLVNPVTSPGPLRTGIEGISSRGTRVANDFSLMGSGKPLAISDGNLVVKEPGAPDRFSAHGFTLTIPSSGKGH
jgi:hypothetical protein